MVPNALSVNEDRLLCSPKKKFSDLEMSCYYGNNSGAFIVLLVIMCLVKGAIVGAKKYSSRTSNAGRKLLTLNTIFGINYIFDLIFAMQLDSGVAAILELTNKVDYKPALFIGKLLAVMMVIITPTLIGYIATVTSKAKNRKEKSSDKESWLLLKDNLKMEGNSLGFFYPEIQGARDILIPIVIVFMHDYPLAQILLTLALMFATCTFKAVFRPFDSRFENIVTVANDLLYSLILIKMLFMHILVDSIGSGFQSFIGWLIIAEIILITAFNLLFSAFVSLSSIWGFLMPAKLSEEIDANSKGTQTGFSLEGTGQ